MAGNFASRLADIHSRCITMFGQNAAAEQLYCWHDGTQITCYEPSRQRARNVVEAAIMQDGESIIHATRAQFSSVPQPGDTITVGTEEATATEYRITDVSFTHIRPFYRITMLDPNKATTAE